MKEDMTIIILKYLFNHWSDLTNILKRLGRHSLRSNVPAGYFFETSKFNQERVNEINIQL